MTRSENSRRTFLKGAAALAAGAAVEIVPPASAQQPATITGGTESAFPSTDAPGSNDGG
jgi:hypothetical protein